MPKKTLKRFMPSHETIKSHKYLQMFGTLLHDPNLFHLNRRSAAGAFAIGLFVAFLPIPFQMVTAAAIAIFIRVNLPLSVALVWISNPITMPPLFYSAYLVGVWITGGSEKAFSFELSWQGLADSFAHLGYPFILGCLICGVVSGAIGYFAIRLLWRYSVVRHLRQRRQRRS
ncbi:DUF2062 domain-containing protein [Corallincola luteus]|uniref:DUF2062 domain-containing protein n=2 Tax=Corallincola TaxID=1775176 RepID=A0A368NSB5_9GAMM|nr:MULTISPECIES: DUF2062 domain-containing protein [Corallincola]RCU52584.1 DUF2062 domain-containing protein [Corallincola holothuriorum]TCI02482.1 DUF2062 domain-containing protein [Corallincola luteus]